MSRTVYLNISPEQKAALQDEQDRFLEHVKQRLEMLIRVPSGDYHARRELAMTQLYEIIDSNHPHKLGTGNTSGGYDAALSQIGSQSLRALAIAIKQYFGFDEKEIDCKQLCPEGDGGLQTRCGNRSYFVLSQLRLLGSKKHIFHSANIALQLCHHAAADVTSPEGDEMSWPEVDIDKFDGEAMFSMSDDALWALGSLTHCLSHRFNGKAVRLWSNRWLMCKCPTCEKIRGNWPEEGMKVTGVLV